MSMVYEFPAMLATCPVASISARKFRAVVPVKGCFWHRWKNRIQFGGVEALAQAWIAQVYVEAFRLPLGEARQGHCGSNERPPVLFAT